MITPRRRFVWLSIAHPTMVPLVPPVRARLTRPVQQVSVVMVLVLVSLASMERTVIPVFPIVTSPSPKISIYIYMHISVYCLAGSSDTMRWEQTRAGASSTFTCLPGFYSAGPCTSVYCVQNGGSAYWATTTLSCQS